MQGPIFDAIPVAYRGLLADQHLVDAQQFGKSLIGVTKLANSVCHEIFHEEITHDPRSYQIRFCVGPSKENGLVQEIFAVVTSGQMPLYTPILLTVGKKLTELLVGAVIEKALGKKKDTNNAVDKIHELAMAHNDFAQQVLRGQMRDKAALMKIINELHRENRASLRQIPEPVGRTVRSLQIGSSRSSAFIDEPAAEVLRSPEQLTLGEPVTYDVKIQGVFKTNGACRIEILDQKSKIVSGKIADATLDAPHNVYTKALDEGAVLRVVAQPTMKDGRLHRLFITSAKIAPKRRGKTQGR
ncbi:hypothetical protein [Bradyrhizobium sp. NBAIM14]|uniref:DUF7947 five-stranded beta-barrel domain-containing protein n=1 Tax=Bradyrhizobium sp. NBAIM14 TaxID=2793814 RepID=UPI001CD3F8F9|nr:hypothetical protein [Bradyrhizobium sp. NBAIM14]MCA1500060.1 hypothetical protein [Bradyrhizobium sp. NBAIM14]